MGRRGMRPALKALLIFGALIMFSTLYLAIVPVYEPCNCEKYKQEPIKSANVNDETRTVRNVLTEQIKTDPPSMEKLQKDDEPSWGPHRLAVIVPFRDRFEELMDFVPYMHTFLNMQKIRHKIFIINQVDVLRFNRGSLINIGYLESRSECDYIAMHDVDLVPMNLNVIYANPVDGPFHASGPDLHPRYHYPTFVGGILLITNEHFKKVNGFSNRYFGWGKEDDEFYVRMREANLTIHRPQNITTGFKTFRHLHDKVMRPRDNKRYFDQKTKSRIRDRLTGLDTVQYELTGRYDLQVLDAPATVVNVGLRCDLVQTPWCVDPGLHQVLEDYRATRDQLIPRDVYAKAPNGSYVKVGVTYEKPDPPVDLKYFLNWEQGLVGVGMISDPRNSPYNNMPVPGGDGPAMAPNVAKPPEMWQPRNGENKPVDDRYDAPKLMNQADGNQILRNPRPNVDIPVKKQVDTLNQAAANSLNIAHGGILGQEKRNVVYEWAEQAVKPKNTASKDLKLAGEIGKIPPIAKEAKGDNANNDMGRFGVKKNDNINQQRREGAQNALPL